MSEDRKFRVRDTSSPREQTALAFELLLGKRPTVEEQEAEVAGQFRESEVLPTDCGNKEDYEKMGIVWGEIVPEDPLFTYATLPEGWKKVSEERDPRHIHLIDTEGKKGRPSSSRMPTTIGRLT